MINIFFMDTSASDINRIKTLEKNVFGTMLFNFLMTKIVICMRISAAKPLNCIRCCSGKKIRRIVRMIYERVHKEDYENRVIISTVNGKRSLFFTY